MASIRQSSPERWVVHLASQSEADREVTVELRMSKATAERLTRSEASRVADLNPGRTGVPAANVGSAVLGILSASATIDRVKDRTVGRNQQELMRVVDEEVDAARASRP